LAPVTAVAAELPASRSVVVGTPATVFATVINAGATTAAGVGISLATPLPAIFNFQTTDPRTNAVTGSPNDPADIPPGANQTFLISITPTAPVGPTDVSFKYSGANPAPAATPPVLNPL